MFQKLFTPLVARFDISPRNSPTPRTAVTFDNNASLNTPRSLNSFNEQESIDVDPEDFARDVLIELMRNAVDRLKVAEDMVAKLETLAEIHRILLEDACTKDVFREMDGFLVLIGVLSTLHATPSSTPETRTADVLEGTRLATIIVCDAIREHRENRVYFETRVGYDSLSEAIQPLLADPSLNITILDHLLSLALSSFPTVYFTTLATSATQSNSSNAAESSEPIQPNPSPESSKALEKALELRASELASSLPPLTNPGALRIIWTGAHLPPYPRLALYKLLERLLIASHRSHVMLAGLGLSMPLFECYTSSRRGSGPGPGPGTQERLAASALAASASASMASSVSGAMTTLASAYAALNGGNAAMRSAFTSATVSAATSAAPSRLSTPHQRFKPLEPFEVPLPPDTLEDVESSTELATSKTLGSSPSTGAEPGTATATVTADPNTTTTADTNTNANANANTGMNTNVDTTADASPPPVSDRERSVMAKLLRRLLETGVSSTAEARMIFKSAVRSNPALSSHLALGEDGNADNDINAMPAIPDTLDPDVLEVIRGATKAKWPPHFSLEPGGALLLDEDGMRGLPTTGGGVTFMAWVFVERLPPPASAASGAAGGEGNAGEGGKAASVRSVSSFGSVASMLSPRSPPPHPLKYGSGSTTSLNSDSASTNPNSSTPGTSGAGEHPILFGIKLPNKWVLRLSLRSDGSLELFSGAYREPVPLPRTVLPTLRWAHVAVVYHANRAATPTVRVFVDGVLTDAMQWVYPKQESTPQTGTYIIGDTAGAAMSWSLASAHMLSIPLPDDVLRLIHHLSPRYAGTFQSPHLAKLLTYESATSLSIHLSGLATSLRLSAGGANMLGMVGRTPLMKALRDGLGVPESAIVFAVSPGSVTLPAQGVSGSFMGIERRPSLGRLNSSLGRSASDDSRVSLTGTGSRDKGWRVEGDVIPCSGYCLDLAVWRLGGAALPLRLVALARSTHELSRALGVLAESLRNSWANSEDMERMRGYDVLSRVLRDKAGLVNVTSFEIMFEMLGLNFRALDQSTVTNTVGYRSLALDFELWAKTPKPIQSAFLDHFSTLFSVSRFKRFNATQRLAKLNIPRKLLFALQTNWFGLELVPNILKALGAAIEALHAPEDSIKPLIQYMAANLHDDPTQPAPTASGAASPLSIMSAAGSLLVDTAARKDKAEQALTLFLKLLSQPDTYARFAGSLPLARVALLLLGDRPAPFVAVQVLRMLATCLVRSTGFARKFELVSGWSILKAVLPRAWAPEVHVAAFDVLLGRDPTASRASSHKGKDKPHESVNGDNSENKEDSTQIACPYICPAIFTSLRRGLETVASQMQFSSRRDSVPARRDSLPMSPGGSPRTPASPHDASPETTVEALIEELIGLHTASSTFRQIFRSQQTTALFVSSYQFFVGAVGGAPSVKPRTVRILEKLTHFALTLALDPDVAGGQKREILDTLQKAEAILDAGTSTPTAIDPALVGDSRSLHRRILSARLSLQVGERAVLKSFAKIGEWRKAIVNSERKRLRKTVLDLREDNRQIEALDEWTYALVSERGIWAKQDRKPKWRLDETEGPYRIRKKLERQEEKLAVTTRVATSHGDGRGVHALDDAQSVTQAELPPWAESYEISTSDIDDQQFAEEVVDDKHRRVRHDLEPGDAIEAVETVARIAGVDSSPGLLITGRTHLYMLDGLVEGEDGEIIDAHDAPKKLFFAPGSIVDLDGPQRALRWSYEQVAGYSDRTFIFRDVALELYFKDSRSLLVVFVSKAQRERFNQGLAANLPSANPTTPATPATFLKTPLIGRVSTRLLTGFRQDELQSAQRKWQAREISNFTYLSIINQISGRTPSDATQYPIFPWVIKDYTSETLDLTSKDTYRDLKCPMGAQNKGRRESAYARYTSLEGVGEQPFHYGTHFSSSMIVCHFLIRLEPYTHMFKTLQGGDWDLPDRLFSDVCRAFHSASKDSRGDVRELIPEFYTCPEFLENSANLDFGIMNTGERIHHVKLPPWAKDDPMLFVTINRLALESGYVSEHLPEWIDLIWGYKQQDPDSFNVFHPLSYEGAIDLDAIEDGLEKEATVGIIHNFGQTPRRIFNTPHPERYHHGMSTLPLGSLSGVAEDYQLMTRSTRPQKDLGSNAPVRELAIDMISERIIPCTDGFVCVPDRPHEMVGWGATRLGKNAGGELRLHVDRKVVHVTENAFPTCAAFADPETLVTGSSDYLVRLWRLERTPPTPRDPPLSVALTHFMRGHSDQVLSIAASRAWAMIVSGSADGTAIFWDLNRGTYTRSLFFEEEDRSPVTLVAINESTGYVATSSSARLCLHTINGRPIVIMDLSAPTLSHYTITSLAFLEREFAHVGVLATGGSDGTIALRTWNADATPSGEKAQWRFVTLRTLKVRDDEEFSTFVARPAVTSLKFVGEMLYHGEETGKVFSWDLPE